MSDIKNNFMAGKNMQHGNGALASLGEHSNQSDGVSAFDFWSLLSALKKWWWVILGLILLSTSIAALYIVRQTPQYRAEAVIEIKQEESRILEGAQVEDVTADQEFMITQMELLKSRRIAEEVIASLNLMADDSFFTLDPNEPALSLDRKRRMVENNFAKRLSVRPVGRSRLIGISFEHSDAAKAARITNSLIEAFEDMSLSLKYESTARANQFLEERLQVVKSSLVKAQRELHSYARENDIVVVDQPDGEKVTGTLDANAIILLNSELAKARSERIFAEAEFEQAKESNFTTEILNDAGLNALKSQRIQLESEYIEKLAVFKPQYPEMVELDKRINLFANEIKTNELSIVSGLRSQAKAKFQSALSKERDLLYRVDQLKDSISSGQKRSIDYDILQREVDIEKTQYEALLQRLKEISASDEIGASLLRRVDDAQVPFSPVWPNKPLIITLALMVGALLGSALAFVLEFIDDRIKTPEDIRQKINQTVVGVIPSAAWGKELDVAKVLGDPQEFVSEAYSSLRTVLQFSSPDGGPRIIHLASTRSGEGKSTSSLGLALRINGIGAKVILVDADLRVPTFNRKSDSGKSIGLSGLLASEIDVLSNIITREKGIDLLPAGPTVPNPSELLSSYRFEHVLDVLSKKYDYIVIDGPPVMGLADASVIGAKIKARNGVTLVVVEANVLRTANVRMTFERLISSGANVVGALLTKYNANEQGYMDYYKYSYGHTSRGASNGSGGDKEKTQLAAKKRYINI